MMVCRSFFDENIFFKYYSITELYLKSLTHKKNNVRFIYTVQVLGIFCGQFALRKAGMYAYIFKQVPSLFHFDDKHKYNIC